MALGAYQREPGQLKRVEPRAQFGEGVGHAEDSDRQPRAVEQHGLPRGLQQHVGPALERAGQPGQVATQRQHRRLAQGEEVLAKVEAGTLAHLAPHTLVQWLLRGGA
eukprot:scaffold5554_cov130-Isochrysis_galbana.AAC.4